LSSDHTGAVVVSGKPTTFSPKSSRQWMRSLNLPLRKFTDAPDGKPHSPLEIVLVIMDFGSKRSISCTPWQLAQLARMCLPAIRKPGNCHSRISLVLRDPVLLRDLFCRVTLGACRQAIRRSLTVNPDEFGLDAVNPVAGGAGRRVAPSLAARLRECSPQFLHDLRMTGPQVCGTFDRKTVD